MSQVDCSVSGLFYADDGDVVDYEAKLRKCNKVDSLLELCEQLGLTVNVSKTKVMVTGDQVYCVARLSPAYGQCWMGEGLSYSATKH
jgi:hypothetical protein